MTKVTQQGSAGAMHAPPRFPSPLGSCWQEQQRRWSRSHLLPPMQTVSASFHPQKSIAVGRTMYNQTHACSEQGALLPGPPLPSCSQPQTPRMRRPTDAEAAQPLQELGAFQEVRHKKKPQKTSLLIKRGTNKQSQSSQSPAGGRHPACPPHRAAPRARGAGSRFPGGQGSICPRVLPCSSLHRHAG